MPRTKGSKNRITASTDFDVQIAKLQKDKAMLEEGLSKTVAHIEELMVFSVRLASATTRLVVSGSRCRAAHSAEA